MIINTTFTKGLDALTKNLYIKTLAVLCVIAVILLMYAIGALKGGKDFVFLSTVAKVCSTLKIWLIAYGLSGVVVFVFSKKIVKLFYSEEEILLEGEFAIKKEAVKKK